MLISFLVKKIICFLTLGEGRIKKKKKKKKGHKQIFFFSKYMSLQTDKNLGLNQLLLKFKYN